MPVTRANDKTEIVAFRVSAKMRSRMNEAATGEGMSAPDWLRYIVTRAVKEAERERVA